MRSMSAMGCPDSSLPDANRPSRHAGCPDPVSNREVAEFLELFNTLHRTNHLLLSYLDEVAASIRAPEAQPLADAIARQAGSIRSRMSLMARLAAELKDTSD